MIERGLELFYWYLSSNDKLGSLFWYAQVVDVVAIEEICLLCLGICLPLRPHFIRGLLMGI